MGKTTLSFDLMEEVLKPVAKRIKERKDSLSELRGFAKNMGFEGWLKVETIATLGKKIIEVRNKGADLLLKGKIEIELKGATDFNLSWIKNGALKYKTPCLFIGDGSDRTKISKLELDENIKIIGYEIFNDGINEWIVGMIRPSTTEEKNESNKKIKDKEQIKSSRPSGKGAPQLHTVESFNELQEVIRIRSLYFPTNYMDRLLLENRKDPLSKIVKKFRQYAEPINNNDFHTITRLKTHINYRKKHDGWIFKTSGDPKDPIVILVGFNKK